MLDPTTSQWEDQRTAKVKIFWMKLLKEMTWTLPTTAVPSIGSSAWINSVLQQNCREICPNVRSSKVSVYPDSKTFAYCKCNTETKLSFAHRVFPVHSYENISSVVITPKLTKTGIMLRMIKLKIQKLTENTLWKIGDWEFYLIHAQEPILVCKDTLDKHFNNLTERRKEKLG